MKGTNAGTNGRQDWRTPAELFDVLDYMYGEFARDAAADENNTKCVDYWTKEDDGLAQDWASVNGTIFCNPPWADAKHWANKAYQAWKNHGVQSVIVLPASVDTQWFYHLTGAAQILILRGRVAYDLPDGTPNPASPDRGTIVAAFMRNRPSGIQAHDWQNMYRDIHPLMEEFRVDRRRGRT